MLASTNSTLGKIVLDFHSCFLYSIYDIDEMSGKNLEIKMIINKPFWYRLDGKKKQAFSYANPAYAKKFAQQYGGDVVGYLAVSDRVSAQLGPDKELFSLIMNEGSLEKRETNPAREMRRFAVLVSDGDDFSELSECYATLREANNAAKTASRYHNVVLVVYKRVTEQPTVLDGLDEVLG